MTDVSGAWTHVSCALLVGRSLSDNTPHAHIRIISSVRSISYLWISVAIAHIVQMGHGPITKSRNVTTILVYSQTVLNYLTLPKII